jgi:AcrR family transcriptional regulator
MLIKIVDHILDNGLGHGISLRSLAKSIGTSPRMLMYFFSSKEQLIADVMRQIRLRSESDFNVAMSAPGGPLKGLLHLYDTQLTAPKRANLWRFCLNTGLELPLRWRPIARWPLRFTISES